MARKSSLPPPPGPPRPKLLTIDEVADRTSLSERTVRRLIASGALPAHRIGRAVRVSEDDLARFLAASRHR
jgi:excisionase family DNA binding protein